MPRPFPSPSTSPKHCIHKFTILTSFFTVITREFVKVFFCSSSVAKQMILNPFILSEQTKETQLFSFKKLTDSNLMHLNIIVVLWFNKLAHLTLLSPYYTILHSESMR